MTKICPECEAPVIILLLNSLATVQIADEHNSNINMKTFAACLFPQSATAPNVTPSKIIHKTCRGLVQTLIVTNDPFTSLSNTTTS